MKKQGKRNSGVKREEHNQPKETVKWILVLTAEKRKTKRKQDPDNTNTHVLVLFRFVI
jgi:hypothetical protein